MFAQFRNKSFKSASRRSLSRVSHWTFGNSQSWKELVRYGVCLFVLLLLFFIFLDIAVGAPYEEGTGAVYIYNGNTPKMEDKYSQRILGRDIRVGLSGFGYYISKFGEDLDENKYNGNILYAYLYNKNKMDSSPNGLFLVFMREVFI